MRILIIEDHPGIQFALALALQIEGHEPVCVDCGEEALKELRSGIFDLVLLDLSTNGMTAAEFIETLRVEFKAFSKSLPVIGVLSASQSVAFESKRLETDFFLAKPFEHEELMTKVREIEAQLTPAAAHGA